MLEAILRVIARALKHISQLGNYFMDLSLRALSQGVAAPILQKLETWSKILESSGWDRCRHPM